jgi:Annexin
MMCETCTKLEKESSAVTVTYAHAEKRFIDILTLRPITHLHAVFNEYEQQHKKKMEKVIKSEMSGDIQRVLIALGKSI